MRSKRRNLLATASVALASSGFPSLTLMDANRSRLGKSWDGFDESTPMRNKNTDAPEYIKAQAKRDRKNRLRLEKVKK